MGREGILHSTASDSAHGTRGIAPEETGRTQVYTDPQSLLEMSRNKEQEQAHPGGSQINKEVVSVCLPRGQVQNHGVCLTTVFT